MISKICKLLPFQRVFSPQRQAHTSAQTHLIQSQKAHQNSLELELSAVKSKLLVCESCRARSLSNVYHLFDETPYQDVVSATKAINQLARQDRHDQAVYLFSSMLVMNVRPNEFTFGTVIPSSICLQDLNLGRQLHACVTKVGLQSNVFVGSAILNLYAKMSTIEEARRAFEDTHEPNVVSYTTLICGYLKKEQFDDALVLFETMPDRNVVTWNAVIGGFSQTGHNEEAVNLFIQMLREGYLPNQSTFPCVICSASNIAALGMGRSFHGCAIKFLGSLNVFVCNSLVTFYSKCGSLDDSLLVFDELTEKSVVSWNALICGFAQNGRAKEALDFLRQMKNTGVQPNSVTLLGALLACNYVGLVGEGYSYFNEARLKDPSLLKPEHYACMVDLLSRFGLLEEAKRFINDLPFDLGIGFWKSLLGGCQINSNMELGELAAKKILALDPGDVSSYVMLSNAHSAAGRWQNVAMVRQEMREKGMKRVPGCSWIEIINCVHVFVTADTRHGEKVEIYRVLCCLLEDVAESKRSQFLTEPFV